METKLAERRARMKRFAKIATVAAVISLPCASSFCVHPLGIAVEGGRTRASRALPLRSLRATAVKVRTGGSGDDDSSDATQRPWPPKERRVKEYSLMEGEVAVRFINSPGRYPSGEGSRFEMPGNLLPAWATPSVADFSSDAQGGPGQMAPTISLQRQNLERYCSRSAIVWELNYRADASRACAVAARAISRSRWPEQRMGFGP